MNRILGGAVPLNMTTDNKAQCIRATCSKDTARNLVFNDVDKRTAVDESVYELTNLTGGGKSFVITATEYKGSTPNHTIEKHERTMIAEPVLGGQ